MGAVSVWEDSVLYERQRSTSSHNPDRAFSISVTFRSSTLFTWTGHHGEKKKKKKKLIGERRRSSNHLSHDNNGSSPIRQKKSKQCSPSRGGGARKVQRWVILRIKSVWVQYSLSLKATHWYDEENKTQTPHHDEELRGQSWTWNIVNDRILMWTNPWIDTIWAAFIST